MFGLWKTLWKSYLYALDWGRGSAKATDLLSLFNFSYVIEK